ncbi:MAG TPA: hypothetical protein VHB98_19345 [Chloroflexota bacterium]|jgi:hypothetical protein|nr:hypothetical protein [Chloroflexota bacterium]
MAADRVSHSTALNAGEVPSARAQSLQRIGETAAYVSQRALQLDEQVQDVDHIVQHLAALTRQLRTLSSNTTLEANRMRMSGPLAEIARQMRRISQQISESNDQLGVTLRGYAVATGELRQAATILLGEARTFSEEGEDSIAGPSLRPHARSATNATPDLARHNRAPFASAPEGE